MDVILKDNENYKIINIEIKYYNIILSGCRNKEDCKKIIEKINKNKYNISIYNKIVNILMSVANSKKNDFSYDDNTMLKYMQDLEKIKYREDAYEVLNNLILNTKYSAQIKTFIRIADSHPLRPQIISTQEIRDRKKEIFISKKCPHCKYPTTRNKNTLHVICGYGDNNGFDWQGCTRDWCFNCGKMLCKQWDRDDQLYIMSNRFHDNKCCKKDAKKRNLDYNDYCSCNHTYVCRK